MGCQGLLERKGDTPSEPNIQNFSTHVLAGNETAAPKDFLTEGFLNPPRVMDVDFVSWMSAPKFLFFQDFELGVHL